MTNPQTKSTTRARATVAPPPAATTKAAKQMPTKPTRSAEPPPLPPAAPTPAKAAKQTPPKPARPAESPPPAPAAAAPDPAVPSGKLGVLVALMQRPCGASVYDMAEAIGWQVHSVRGALAGPLKTRGFVITSEKLGDHRIYCIAPPPRTPRGRSRKAG